MELSFQSFWCFQPKSKPLKTVWSRIKEALFTSFWLKFWEFSYWCQYTLSLMGDFFLPETGKRGRDSREEGEILWHRKTASLYATPWKNKINRRRVSYRFVKKLRTPAAALCVPVIKDWFMATDSFKWNGFNFILILTWITLIIGQW